MSLYSKKKRELLSRDNRDDISYYTSKKKVNCPNSFKNKLLFNSEKEANLFIQYAKEKEFHKGYKPVRAYFCDSCKGWHVTSEEKKINVNRYKNPFYLLRDWTKGWQLVNYYKNDHIIELTIPDESGDPRSLVVFEDELMDRVKEHNPFIEDAYIDKYNDKRFVIIEHYELPTS